MKITIAVCIFAAALSSNCYAAHTSEEASGMARLTLGTVTDGAAIDPDLQGLIFGPPVDLSYVGTPPSDLFWRSSFAFASVGLKPGYDPTKLKCPKFLKFTVLYTDFGSREKSPQELIKHYIHNDHSYGERAILFGGSRNAKRITRAGECAK